MMFWFALPLTLALYFMTRALYRRLPAPLHKKRCTDCR